MRVVLIDDHAMVRELFTHHITVAGWSVAGEAETVAEGLAVTRAEVPDAVVLDLSMPGGGSLEAIPDLREAAPDAVIVVVSATPRDQVEASVLAAGADGYLEKTVRFNLTGEIASLAGKRA